MGDWLKRMAGKAVMTVLGLVLWIGWMTLRGDGDSTEVQKLAELPPIVFEGGGGTFEIDVEVDQAAQLTASFERWNGEDASELVSSSQPLAPGEHHFSVDVPEATYGYFEIGVPEAEVGAEITWTLRLDGEVLQEEEVELEQPLDPDHAFFVNFEFDEIEELREYAQQ